MQQSNITLVKKCAVLIFIFFVCFYGIASYPLADNNEGMYAEIAKEMYLNHHWVTPRLNTVPYIEKPPLLYWLINVSYHLFGISEFSTRFIPAISATLLCILMLALHKSIKQDELGWFAVSILASSLGFILVARIVFFDMLLTTCFSAGLLL